MTSFVIYLSTMQIEISELRIYKVTT